MLVELQPWLKEAAPFAAMVMLQVGSVGMNTITKAALRNGMSSLVYLVYFGIVGVLILLPHFIFHRFRGKGCPLTLSAMFQFFILASLGTGMLTLTTVAINLSNPTLAAALANLTPLFTFLLAIIYRMEAIDMRSGGGRAKLLGTIVLVSGALVMTLYKGPAISPHITAIGSNSVIHHNQLLFSQRFNWVLGGFFLFMAYLLGALTNVHQAAFVKEYPDMTTIVFFVALFSTIQCAAFTLIVERNPNSWLLRTGIEYMAVVFSAIYGPGIRMTLVIWCLKKKGPLFVSMFEPLGMVIAAAMGFIFLGDLLHFGRQYYIIHYR